ncbi:MAG: photosynthetic complex assembly protein PuhC [Alphaproteobacteria bacterium]
MQHSLQSKDPHREMVPMVLIRAMFALMFITTGLVAYAQWAQLPQVGVPEASPVVRALTARLVTHPHGKTVVLDEQNRVLASSSDPMNGFIDVIGRANARARLVAGTNVNTPVVIVQRQNGHVAIEDLTRGDTIELVGYGADNVAAFTSLLERYGSAL